MIRDMRWQATRCHGTVTDMRRTGTLLLLALLLTGCGHSTGNTAEGKPSASPSPSPSSPAGPRTFLAEVRAVGLGTRNVAAEADNSLLGFGNLVCSSLTVDHLSYGLETQVIVTTQPGTTNAQAETVIRSAVNNLCPTAKGLLP